MKRYTTRFLKTAALGYMAFPISYLLLVALLFDIPADVCGRILLSPWFYFLTLWAVLGGWGLWEMKRWGWYVFILANVFMTYTNAILCIDYGESHHKVAAFTVSVVVLWGIVYRLAREVRVPYFLPKIRWWESDPRYRLVVPVRVKRVAAAVGPASEPLPAEILDLSLSGCFVKLRTDLEQDEVVVLDFTIFGHPMALNGTVVWRTQSTVTNPKGIGVKFVAVTRGQRRALRAANQRLKKISALYRSSRYLMNQEDFVKKLTVLQSERLGVKLDAPEKPKA